MDASNASSQCAGGARFGFWRETASASSSMPWPQSGAWDPARKLEFLHALAQLTAIAAVTRYRGFHRCRICQRPAGSQEYAFEGRCWPQGLAHYVRDHDVILPDEDVDWVIAEARRAAHTHAPVSRRW